MNVEQKQEFEWCPGAESNHRHEDFQSTALPLSYPGTGRRLALGEGLLCAVCGSVQRLFERKSLMFGRGLRLLLF